MDVYLAIGATVFGAIIGSFLNALSFRWGTGHSVLRGRSRCMQCGHTLGWRDLFPIFSYLYLRGRCRYCRSRISVQYPLVEAVAALISIVVYLQNPLSLFAYAFWLMVWMTLLFVAVYDLRHTVIPWACTIALAVLALLYLALHFGFGGAPGLAQVNDGLTKSIIWALLAGPLLALPLFLFSLISRGTWMGWGDGALELSLGWFLGLAYGASALMIAFWSGAFVGVLLILLSKLTPTASSRGRAQRFTIKSEIPFAPFLVLGAFIVYALHLNFFITLPLLWQ
ncbi:prepilin peptidase [Patescibacteria group bacterium]|nr:prepilin peptidase [Patescibacteria group bacterium]